MANGEAQSDLDEFVLRSGVRTGLKREFAFALKAQASLSISPGRTRSGKALASPVASPRGRKRPKKSVGEHLTPDPAGRPDLVCPSHNAVAVEVPIVVDCEVETVTLTDSVELKTEVATEAPASIEAVQESTMKDHILPPVATKPLKVFVRSPRGRWVGLQKSPCSSASPTVLTVEAPIESCEGGGGSSDKGSAADNLTLVVDDIGSINVDGLVSGPQEEMPASTLEESTVVSPPLVALNHADTMDESSVVSPLQQAAVDNKSILIGSSTSVGNQDKPKNFRRFTRSVLKASTSVGTIDLTRDSATKNNTDDTDKGNASQQLERPQRRFTRSLLNVKADNPGSVDGSSVSSESGGSEETKGARNIIIGAASSTPKKKMELKMSKKIALTKLPTNSKELISTGLLEGLTVRYANFNGKLTQLQGVIKGNGILCSCSSCNGSIVVSTNVFEQHAGSTKRHPADFIYLSNGNSLQDVLNACTSAPLDMLEAVIQGAAGLPPEKSSVCQKCKGSYLTSRTGDFALLCDKCLEPKQVPRTPSPVNMNVSATRLSRANAVPGSSDGSSKNLSSNKKATTGKLTRKDVGLHKLVFMNDILPEGTEVGYYVRGKRLREGYIKDSGIYCLCCNTVISPSQFEAHAGQASRKKPYNYIYTSNGVSLHELSISLSKGRKLSTSQNDDLCSICADGGNLLLCDLCPRAFHKGCIGLSSIPKGDWCCQYCISLRQRERFVACNDNAIAAGRVAGVDPIEQIFKRCIRMVTTEFDIGGCTLCRLHDFSKSRFDDRTVMICDQCEKEYHVGCLRDHKMADLKELPEGEWFCCAECSRIRTSLQELLQRGPDSPLPLNIDVIKKKCGSNDMNEHANVDIRWRLLSGKTAKEESKLLLSRAVAIFHESFDPIVDVATGRDLIPSMVYGRTVRDQDYGGMYCAILTVGTSVVSAGILRVLGGEVGELPLVATSREYQGKGYFQSLFACIERLLASLNVKHFVLPAADEAESIWTKKFGFSKITSEELENILNGVRTTVFQGTSVLHKPVPPALISCREELTAHEGPMVSCLGEPIAQVEPIASGQGDTTVDAEPIISCLGEPSMDIEPIVSCQGEPTSGVEPIISCQGEPITEVELIISSQGEPTADIEPIISYQGGQI